MKIQNWAGVEMRSRFFAAIAGFVLFAVIVSAAAAGQNTPSAQRWKAPRTPDGQPDLQGVWTTSTLTPLERPPEFAGKQFFTEEEASEYEKRIFAQVTGDRRDGGPDADLGRSYNEFWRDRGTKVIASRRTSLIVDPPDGRIPALTLEAQSRLAAARDQTAKHPADGPEDRSAQERCLTRGVPIVPGNYNNNYQIVQSPGYVMILHEMNHDARIVPLDGRPHHPQNVRGWFGDPRGRWEGDTLVVESTNFSQKTNFRGANAGLRLIERFTRVDADTISYQFTVTDPTTFTRPWSAEIPMRKAEGLIYEYACHEGNYSLSGILAGARAEEKRVAEEQRTPK
jgi:hypothetical protein